MTSNSCSGTCLILSSARQPWVSEADSGPAGVGRSRVASADRSAGADGRRRTGGGGRGHRAASSACVGIGRRPRPRPRRDGRSGRGTPRRGWAGRASTRLTAMPASASSASAGATRSGTATPRRERSGIRTRGASRRRGAATAGRRAACRCAGSCSRTCSAPDPTSAFSWPRRALGDHPAVVDHRDAVGELIGLVEVLRGEQHGGADADHRAHDVPHLVAAARVEAGGRLVEEEQVRRDDDAGRRCRDGDACRRSRS